MQNLPIENEIDFNKFQLLDDSILNYLKSIKEVAYPMELAIIFKKEILPHETKMFSAESIIKLRVNHFYSKGLVRLILNTQDGQVGWMFNDQQIQVKAYQDPHFGMSLKYSERVACKQNKSHASFGFTLIELMVVLVIIGVLAALIVPNVLDRADDARVTAARTDVGNLMQALKLYKLDNMRYPSAEQGLQALVAKPNNGSAPLNWKPYLEKLPSDPWGRSYQYLNPGIKGKIDVMSFGAEGQSGGEGKDSDIGSWQ